MLNKVILMGRLTADPELRQTPNNIATCRFSVAVDRPYQKDAERQADFINVVVWRQTAEFVSKYFSKGKMIIVEGSLRNNNYTDKNGVKHYGMDVVADNVSFGESKSASQGGNGNYSNNNSNFQTPNNNPAPAPQNTNSDSSLAIGDLSDFEELTSSDEGLPF